MCLGFVMQNLSIRNVPDAVADQLKARAQRNHRSLQGEIVAILEEAVGGAAGFGDAQREFVHGGAQAQRKLTITEIAELVRKSGLRTPAESVQMIREDRDR